jgi:hypothetical protein
VSVNNRCEVIMLEVVMICVICLIAVFACLGLAYT